jgi:hypothetical protein
MAVCHPSLTDALDQVTVTTQRIPHVYSVQLFGEHMNSIRRYDICRIDGLQAAISNILSVAVPRHTLHEISGWLNDVA